MKSLTRKILLKPIKNASCYNVLCCSLLVPGQPSKFQVGAVSDTSIELMWEPAYEKEGIISYELRYMEGSFGTQVRFYCAVSYISCNTKSDPTSSFFYNNTDFQSTAKENI